ncbi:MAG: DMT family transporter, partial [Clostridiales bacterium]|nr:DMT family transporter [Clostridiales bacterium]
SMSSVTFVRLNAYMTGAQALPFAFLLAFVFLALVNWKQGKLSQLKSYRLKDFVIMAAMGSLGVLAYNMLNMYAYRYATGMEAAALSFTWPIWIAIFSVIILREKMTSRKAIVMLISFFGMLLVVTRGNFSEFANANLFGISLALLCGFSYGLFGVLTKKVTYDKSVAMMMYFAWAAIVAFAYLFAFDDIPQFALTASLWILLRGIGQLGIAYTLWTMALMGDTVKIATLSLITPFLQLLMLVIFTGEVLGIIPVVGLVFIVGGAFLGSRSK